jgi:hypothetical protein
MKIVFKILLILLIFLYIIMNIATMFVGGMERKNLTVFIIKD